MKLLLWPAASIYAYSKAHLSHFACHHGQHAGDSIIKEEEAEKTKEAAQLCIIDRCIRK